MGKELFLIVLLVLISGCGNVDETRHEVDVQSEIAIQNRLDSVDEEKTVGVEVDKGVLSVTQETLLDKESNTKEEKPLINGLEYTSTNNDRGFE